jgi:hypothetical protein
VWAENGDALSRAYVGTETIYTDFTTAGLRSVISSLRNISTSAKRYIRNRFCDSAKQVKPSFHEQTFSLRDLTVAGRSRFGHGELQTLGTPFSFQDFCGP